MRQFKAMVVEEIEDKKYMRKITDRSIDDLPKGEVLVKVGYSSLNYKDALSASGNRGVTRKYPHTPGIDAAGVVTESAVSDFVPGDKVIVTSYDLGMNTPGGFGQYIRVPADWVVSLPENMTLKESMAYGTAGFTAALSVLALKNHHVIPGQGDILVTGASGGVGSIAISILTRLGYTVVAVSGKEKERQFLHDLGVVEILTRKAATDLSGRPLLRERWAGVLDTVGGDILATAIKSTKMGGTVTCCGNVASHELNTTVFPFILRGVCLVGINSQNCPMDIRRQIWLNLADSWKVNVDRLMTETTLDDLDENIEKMLRGKLKGRVVLHHR
jgi:putative YhdH/YhfP family quinone oxidoreductase